MTKVLHDPNISFIMSEFSVQWFLSKLNLFYDGVWFYCPFMACSCCNEDNQETGVGRNLRS